MKISIGMRNMGLPELGPVITDHTHPFDDHVINHPEVIFLSRKVSKIIRLPEYGPSRVFDKTDNRHRPLVFGTNQRIHLLNPLARSEALALSSVPNSAKRNIKFS